MLGGSIGPASSTKFKLTAAISEALLEHTKYVSNMSLWNRFLIWRYTLGSGSLNLELIGIAKDDQKLFWTYNFFKSYNYDIKDVGKKYEKYGKYFGSKNALSYLKSSDRESIADYVITNVIVDIEKIILGAPVIKKEFEVYKVSTKYPGLPEDNELDMTHIVHQKPFNSTTYNPQFNFAPFIAEDSTCCLHKINIKKGSKVLMIPSEYHAYPMELECLLPFNSAFKVKEVREEDFDYIPKENQKFIEVQDMDKLVIGQVYMYDPLADNRVRSKKLTYYISEYINP